MVPDSGKFVAQGLLRSEVFVNYSKTENLTSGLFEKVCTKEELTLHKRKDAYSFYGAI